MIIDEKVKSIISEMLSKDFTYIYNYVTDLKLIDTSYSGIVSTTIFSINLKKVDYYVCENHYNVILKEDLEKSILHIARNEQYVTEDLEEYFRRAREWVETEEYLTEKGLTTDLWRIEISEDEIGIEEMFVKYIENMDISDELKEKSIEYFKSPAIKWGRKKINIFGGRYCYYPYM